MNVISSYLYINRIKVEFKFMIFHPVFKHFLILIESKWNLNDNITTDITDKVIILIESKWNLNTGKGKF